MKDLAVTVYALCLWTCIAFVLSALQLPLGKTTVMHLVPRENLPEPNPQGKKIPVICNCLYS